MAGMRTARRILVGGAALAAAGWALRQVPAELGVRPLASGPDRAARIRRSPQFRDGSFVNTMPEQTTLVTAPPVGLLGELAKDREQRHPTGLIPLRVPPTGPPPADGVRAIWYGHASTLVEIEGRRVLFDPVWSRRPSPPSSSARSGTTPCPWSWASCPRWTRSRSRTTTTTTSTWPRCAR
ncbi:hypothetical protein ACFQ0B_58595 [Nonomuraea thailandensis]